MKRYKALLVTLVSKFLGTCVGRYFSWLLVFAVKNINPSENKCEKKVINILALSPSRFRGDLQILAKTGNFKIIVFPEKWHDRILGLINLKLLQRQQIGVYDYINNAKNKINRPIFLKRLAYFIEPFIKILDIDIILSPGIHYKRDLDLGEAIRMLGPVYIVSHRECLKTNKWQQDEMLQKLKKLNSVKLDYIISQNEVVKDIFIKSGLSRTDNSYALGCLRMDELFRNSIHKTQAITSNKQVTLFSFTHCAGLYGLLNAFTDDDSLGYVNLFKKVHVAIAKLAVKYPNVNFVIKTKWLASWEAKIMQCLAEVGMDLSRLNNLIISDSLDAHDLIKNSCAVIGFGSTTLLEALMFRKPVIFPLFEEASDKKYRECVQFYNERTIFDVADSYDSFIQKVSGYIELDVYQVNEEKYKMQLDVFEKYVSPTDGSSLEKYTNFFKKVYEKNQQVAAVDSLC